MTSVLFGSLVVCTFYATVTDSLKNSCSNMCHLPQLDEILSSTHKVFMFLVFYSVVLCLNYGKDNTRFSFLCRARSFTFLSFSLSLSSSLLRSFLQNIQIDSGSLSQKNRVYIPKYNFFKSV